MSRQPKRKLSTLGERFKAAREEKEMSQAEVANLLALSRAAIAQWESDTTSPSLKTVGEAAGILGVSREWLAFGIADPQLSAAEANVEHLPELIFDRGAKPTPVANAWSFPRDWLRADLRCGKLDTLAVWRVEGSNMMPKFEDGDRVIVDTSVTKPSLGGVFLHWDGVGPVINSIVVRPVDGKPMALVSSTDGQTPSFEADVNDLTIIGRVKGVLKGG